MAASLVTCPSLIGRARELRDLVDHRLRAARGRGGVVLIEGESGIGKSRLARAFRATLTGGRASFGIGYCRDSCNAPYGPFIDALASLGCHAPLLPARSRGEQAAALCESLVRSCRRRNTVFVLEDLQWADAGTLSLLLYVLPLIESLPLLLVATCRSDELNDGGSATSHVARLRRFAAPVPLRPLKEHEVRQLIRGAAGPGLALARSELDEIVERAEGNPFFAEELLKDLLERRESGREPRALPLTIRASVLERISRLDAGDRQIAQCAAILGRSFESSVLAEACERMPAQVLSALSRLRDLQIIDEEAPAGDSFAFRHALTRDVIYQTMLAEEARPLHERVLRILERRDGTSPHDIGYHAWVARDAIRCEQYNERAGDQADAVHAYTDAVRCYERALELAAGYDERCRLLSKAAASSERDGKAERALAFYAAASEAAEAAADTKRAAELRGAMAVATRLAGDSERALALLSRALLELDPSETQLRARFSLNMAFSKLDCADVAAAEALIAEASEASDTSLYWSAVNYAAAIKGEIAGVRKASARYIDLCAPLGPVAVLRARFNFAFSLCVLGVDEDALEIFDELLSEVHTLRLSGFEVLACANAALVQARRGNVRAAQSLVERALAVPEPSTTAPIALAAAALTVANLLGEEELISCAVSEEILATAFRCKIDSAIARIAGPYARWLWSHDERHEARALLKRALESIHSPFGASETLLEAMELGDDATIQLAREAMRSLEARPAVPLYAATAAHMRAIDAHRTRDAATSFHAVEAERLYHTLGWPVHAARCVSLRCDSQPARRHRRSETAGELRRAIALSAREREIARLVATGASNKALADRFTITQRTVEKHLTSIYTKLGLRNRSQLAAIMTRRQE